MGGENMSFSLIEQAKIVNVQVPIDMTGAAATTEYISMKNAQKAYFIIATGSMSSTSNQAVTLVVADDASGTHTGTITSASASCTLSLDNYWVRAASADALTKTTVSSSTFNLTKSDDNKTFVIEVDANAMGTFSSGSTTYNADYVAISVATPGAHACLISIQCILTGLRYAEDVPPTAIT
jgi:hypothetical protein